MMLRTKVLSLLVCGLVLSSVQAGYLLKRSINQLTAGDWFLAIREDDVCLVNKKQENMLLRWAVSAPTLLAIDRKHSFDGQFQRTGRANRSPNYEGKYLCLAGSKETPRVKLLQDKDDSCTWAFDFISKKGPTGGERFASDYIGFSSRQFRLKVGSGKYEGQFVAAEPLSEEQKSAAQKGETVVRRLWLTDDAKQALTLDYVDAEFKDDGK